MSTTHRTSPAASGAATTSARARKFLEEYVAKGAQRPLFSCVTTRADGTADPASARTTVFAPDSTAFNMVYEIGDLAGRKRKFKERFPALELSNAPQVLATPTPAIQASAVLTVTFDPNDRQRRQAHTFQLSGESMVAGLGMLRTAYSTQPFTFDADGQAVVTVTHRGAALGGEGRPDEPLPTVTKTLHCKVE